MKLSSESYLVFEAIATVTDNHRQAQVEEDNYETMFRMKNGRRRSCGCLQSGHTPKNPKRKLTRISLIK